MVYSDGTTELAVMMDGFVTGLGSAFSRNAPAAQKTVDSTANEYVQQVESARQSGIEAGEKAGRFIRKTFGF